MTIRPLTPSDWPDAQALYQDLTEGGALADKPMFDTVLAHPGTTIYGKEQNGQIIAMVTLHILPNMTYGGRPYGLIENVVTAANARGQGIGRQVMAHVAGAARDAGCYKLMLLTGKGRDAKGFYETVGFEADEKWGMIRRF